MPIQCPVCSKVNPSDAAYCYYDGRALAQGSQEGPLRLGTLPFPMPFCFSDGQSCANFNQLALACDERWDEARRLLAEGLWQSFFSAMGRLDLAVAAKDAVKQPDLDVGLSQLLERFPADPDVLRPPKLVLSSTEEDLGIVSPGKDHKFDLRLTNRGMLVLRGMVTTDCDWLSFGERAGGSLLKMFQTRNIYTLPVCVLGSKLRAGRKPFEADIVIDTNGGAARLRVRAQVPIQPFPKGVLAGAKSPHALAVKAKARPEEAAVLFEQGAVRTWYASNGWTYPIRGTDGTGRGAVQQFFEALGLTKPPPLEISSTRLLCKGRPGHWLTKHVTISTKEARPVYAEAWSNKDWIKAGKGKSQGNAVTIPLQIQVPPRPGETLHADVAFRGNGNQQFVVAVTLAVADAGPMVDDDAEEKTGVLRRVLIFAGVGLLLLVVIGVVALVVAGHRNEEPEKAPIAGNDNPPPPVPPAPPPKNGAWWDGIPGTKLPASVLALKKIFPEHQALFDGLKLEDDRPRAYDKLAAKLPDLVRDPKARKPLGHFLAECCVFESELNFEAARRPLRQALTSQIPRDGAAFLPEREGDELECALWSLHVAFSAMSKASVSRPERVRSLADELGRVFGFDLDTRAPLDELKTRTEELLARRCYRGTLLTAGKSIEHALEMRGLLIEKLPRHLAPAARENVDVDLIAVGLSKGNEAWPKVWPKLEPMLRECLQTNNLNISVKIVDMYRQADPALAQKMEEVLAANAKFKAAVNAKLTHAKKVAAIHRSLTGPPDTSPAERRARLEKLTRSALSAVKAQEQGVLLNDTLRLAHASTMATILMAKEPDVERFDDLVSRVPEIEQPESAKAANAKSPDQKPKQSAAGNAIGDQPWVFRGRLTPKSDRDHRDPDPGRRGHFCDVHPVTLKAGLVYIIDMVGTFEFDPYLRLEDPRGIQVAWDDDSGGGHNSRIMFRAPAEGVYRVIATTFGGAVGSYTLRVRGIPFGGGGFGMPAGKRAFFPGGMPGPAEPEPNDKNEKKKTQLSPSDLKDLDSKQSHVRIAAFQRLAGSVSDELAPRHAQRIAKYLLSVQQNECEDVIAKLESFAKCRHVLLALADGVGKNQGTQRTTEAIVGGLLGQPLAGDRDWRSACRRMLLERALELTEKTSTAADQAAEKLRDLYKEQGLVLGIEDPNFVKRTRPTQVLAEVIKHVAGKTNKQNLASEDKKYVEQLDHELRAAEQVAANDLEYMVLLQRHWLKVLTIQVGEQSPSQAKAMTKIQSDLVVHDSRSRSVLDQLRAGEEKVLRVWALAHSIK